MKVSLNWLREYIDINLPLADLADRLTMAGIEVSGMPVTGGNLGNIVVGQIVAINPHPNADRLTLVTIDLGTEQSTVVCGAPNLRLGDKVAFAHVDAQLIDPRSGQVCRLKPAKIRGVTSSGMACSEKELGISDSHEGIMILSEEAPVGTSLADYLGDTVLDLEVTPNRPDCLSVIGIAREIAALTGQSLHLAEISYKASTSPIDSQISVEIVDPDLCPRYCASLVTGIKVAESPQWLQQRLLNCGMRPINNIVDVTNYVMLEYGQPLHAFDYHRIRGKKIVVRRATAGEVIVSLDWVKRTLDENMLVIADEERAVAIAGVMGGANSEVTESATTLLLESANFNPASIHRTGSLLRLPSEACMRFERGIRPELTIPALKRATHLILQLAGGKAAKGLADVYPGKRDSEPILLSTEMVERVLGVEFGFDQIVSVLSSLGFDCKPSASVSEVRVTAPYWRSDIQQAVDLVEEVARIIGYDKIPATMLSQQLPRQNPDPIINLKRQVRYSLIGYGFDEIVTYSLTSSDMLNKLLTEPRPLEPVPLRMANPMTAEQEYLRTNLRANLLDALASNRRHEDGNIRLFELGKVYLPRPNDLPSEPEVLCGVLSGSRLERSWQGGYDSFDFYEAKGVVEGLLSQVDVEASFEKGGDESLHPVKQATIIVDGNRVGVVGELHPKVSPAFDISETVYLFEIDLSSLLPFTIGHKMFQPILRFPTIVRDIALIVDTGVTHQQVSNIISSFPLVKQVSIFDAYVGEPIPPGKKSLAYRITFQSPTHTMTDDEVSKVQQKTLSKLSSELGAMPRS
ncbi:MAG: phenylalanine--tRNA ligase subunit beta [Dehalococcoidales bacterium]|nr:phenylalanine--tRNA ligase subunit beta [Dehalococcoidales bacterium]